jgi:hypothetical protein
MGLYALLRGGAEMLSAGKNAKEPRRLAARERRNCSEAYMLSIVPAAGEMKWTVLFNAVDTSERLSVLGR